jgi:hypothetical protein
MNKNFNLDDLENFLSESIEDHRMYPSDRVWRNIDQELHGHKRWPALTFGTILTGAIIIAGLIFTKPDKNLFSLDAGEWQSTIANNQADVKQLANAYSTAETTDLIEVPKYKKVDGAPTVSFYTGEVINVANDLEDKPLNAFADKQAVVVPMAEKRSDIITHPPSHLASLSLSEQEIDGRTASQNFDNPLLQAMVSSLNRPNDVHADEDFMVIDGEILDVAKNQSNSLAVDNKVLDKTVNTSFKQTDNKKSRWNIQYFVAPSISYRYLGENKVIDLHLAQNGPIAPNLTNGVNNFVRHKSSLGLEAGTAVMYDVTPNFRVKMGMQFNYRSYKIDAFAVGIERSTIVLDNGSNMDSIILYSSISNLAGYRPIELSNKYYQVAVPVGFDLKMAGSKNLNFYVGASVAPTYQFNKSAYVITTDYKNYLKKPDLMRNFNLNAAIEAFASYELSNGTIIQAGPQIRYQMLPGTTKQYPIREHLMDFGLKVGVVKSLK